MKTTDLALAAYLGTQGYKCKLETNSNNRSFDFVFDPEYALDLEAIKQDYDEGRLVVEPRALYNELQALKSRIHDNR